MIARACVTAFALAALALPASADGDADFAWGQSEGGLRVGLAATAHSERLRGVTLELRLENTGDQPLRIPGRLRLPWNWRFDFEPGQAGPELVGHFATPPEPEQPQQPQQPQQPIELAPGEFVGLQFDCRNWLQHESRTIARPRAGPYTLRASSVPVGAELDPEAWTGNVRSGDVRVEISFRD